MTKGESIGKVPEEVVGVWAMRAELSGLLTRKGKRNDIPWYKNMYGPKSWFGISRIVDSGDNEGCEVRVKANSGTNGNTVGVIDISICLYGKPRDGSTNKAVIQEGYMFGRKCGSFDRLPTGTPVESGDIGSCLTEVKEWLKVVNQ